jgi:hypothetical protein
VLSFCRDAFEARRLHAVAIAASIGVQVDAVDISSNGKGRPTCWKPESTSCHAFKVPSSQGDPFRPRTFE